MSRTKKLLVDAFKGWGSTIAIIISALALIISCYTSCETREHNRLSLSPYLTISYYTNETGAGWTHRQDGLGTAIIKSFEVTVDGKEVSGWKDLIDTIKVPRDIKSYTIPYIGSPISPSNSEGTLFWVNPGRAAEALNANIERVEINICYCSLYQEYWKTKSHRVNNQIQREQVKVCPETKIQFTNDLL